MERTVVRCAEGHVFSTASFPMQTTDRLGPGRLFALPALCAAAARGARRARQAVAIKETGRAAPPP